MIVVCLHINCSHSLILCLCIVSIMNILSFVALRNIGAGTFTIFAQCKILTTAAFSALILNRHYSTTKWRSLISLVFGVLLFSEHIWNKPNTTILEQESSSPMVVIGIAAVLIEVTLSGFASIYFEKVIKLDPLPLTIWERNFQLALVSSNCGSCCILRVSAYDSFCYSDRTQNFNVVTLRCIDLCLILSPSFYREVFLFIYALYCGMVVEKLDTLVVGHS